MKNPMQSKAQMAIETSANATSSNRKKFSNRLQSSKDDPDELSFPFSNMSESSSPNNSPTKNEPTWEAQFPPFSSATSPLSKSPWSSHVVGPDDKDSYTGLMGSLVRKEGHVYSLATSGELLYTGSDSKNIRVWKNQKEFCGFKSNSGLVKAIIISGERIFTGHQDGKIRIWKVSHKNPSVHKRVGALPTFKAFIKSSMNPNNYVEVRRNKNAVWIRHFDAISCLSLSEDKQILYSASWDKTIKVWQVSNSKCLESIKVHDDAVNAIVSGFDGHVFTGSADGTVKIWRREMQGKGTKHFFSQILLKQDYAITALAVSPLASVLYCGSSDGVVTFWEWDKLHMPSGCLRGHKLAVLCLATAGELVMSGSADTKICVWRKEREGLHTWMVVLTGHMGPVKCLAVEEDKQSTESQKAWIVYSGSLDKSVKIWQVTPYMPNLKNALAIAH